MRSSLLRPALFLALAAACSNAGEKLTFPAVPNGAIGVSVYLDRDGSQSFTSADTLFDGARVALFVAGGTDTFRVATTGKDGLAVFDTVPLGSYRVGIDLAALGDSIAVVSGDTGTIRILARNDSIQAGRQLRLGYQEVTIAQARGLPPGKRVFIRGIVLSPLQAFRDSASFVSDPTGMIRITGARHRPGRAGNNVGDSVLVLGTTGASLGQPVLIDGLFGTLGETPPPVAQVVTVGEARTAKGGTLDAGLVQVVGAIITDTMPAAPDFLVKVGEAANLGDQVSVLLDQQLAAPTNLFGPGRTFTVRGVLVPRGDGTWEIKPRGGLDIALSN
jgi:hypothetical protein